MSTEGTMSSDEFLNDIRDEVVQMTAIPEDPDVELLTPTTPINDKRRSHRVSRDTRHVSVGVQYSARSSVDVNFFDREGVAELRRSLGRMGALDSDSDSDKKKPFSPAASDATLAEGEDIDVERDFSFERTLRQILKKQDASNIQGRDLGVAFEDLRVVGLGSAASYQPTLGSMLNPLNILGGIRNMRHPVARDILNDFSGVVRPGEMLLVLGRPGSGCSTLLKTLANQRGEYHAVEGTVNYDSLTPDDIEKHYRGDVQYCPEDDVHFPTLTVEETIKFAAKLRAPRERMSGYDREKYTDLITNILTTVFGLNHTKQTVVGDAAIRGVSGGEKKRVSICEALAASRCLGAWDNSTRGLDASTALKFVQALRIATDLGHLTTLVSIYQAGESLYQLFDKVCVIYEGRMAYFGPANCARQYFIDMGYQPAHRQTTADFLVACTDPNGRTQRPGLPMGVVPRTAAEFAAHFKQSHYSWANKEDINDYREEFVGMKEKGEQFIENARADHAKNARFSSPYLASVSMQVRAVMARRVKILKGSLGSQIATILSFIISAVMLGTLFLKVPESTSAFFSRGGVLFFSLLYAALSTMAEIPALYGQRPIVLRHKKAALYHPFIESMALTLVDIPITFLTLAVFSVMLYFLVRLQQSVGQFFIFFAFLLVMSLTMKTWFRMLASAFKSPAPAQSLAGISLLVLILYTGFTIPQPSIIGALRWITYINPLRYGFESVMTNEFHTLNGACATLVPSGAGYTNITIANQVCTSVGSVQGQAFVNGDTFLRVSYGFEYSNTWRNFGIVCAFGMAFFVGLLVFTEVNTGVATQSAITLFKRNSSRAAKTEDDRMSVVDEEKLGASTSRVEKRSSTLPAEVDAITSPTRDVFSWRDLRYTVSMKDGEQRKLLNDISGFVAPGKLTALMGESGAGKTTLLNILAQRTSVGVITGDLCVNGLPLPADFQAQTGYCQQTDTHMTSCTVREALLFSAKMRQPSHVPTAEKEAYVETCLKSCGLEDYADATVGSLGVEMLKRTTIGVELVAKPKLLLFLDEPSSGLDSQSSWAVIQFLRQLADSGQAILCTIHQPSAELFQVFDRLLLLRKGGSTVYFGDLGYQASSLLGYFERNGARPCDPEENPAEYMLEVIGAGAGAVSDQDWHDVWKRSPEAASLKRQLDEIHSREKVLVSNQGHHAQDFATSWIYQVSQLTQRASQYYWRNPTYLMAKLVLNIAGGLVIGFTFFKSPDTQQGTQDKLFSIFMSTILAVPLANQLQVPFIYTRDVYEIRERWSRMYSWSALVTSQILVELPWDILGSSLYFCCWYWTVGFSNERGGLTYLLLGVLFPLYYTTCAQAVAAMLPTVEITCGVFNFLFNFVITFCGVLQPVGQLGWWKWMYYLSPFTYLIAALLGQGIGELDIECSATELVHMSPPSGQTCAAYMQTYIAQAGGYLTNPDATDSCNFCTYRTTDQYIGPSFGIHYAQRWRNLGIFCAFIGANTICIYLFTWLFRVRSGSVIGTIKKRFASRKPSAKAA